MSLDIDGGQTHVRFNPHEERAGLVRTVLLGFHDVAAGLKQRPGHVVDDARLVWAGQAHHNTVAAVDIAVASFALHRVHDSGGLRWGCYSLSCCVELCSVSDGCSRARMEASAVCSLDTSRAGCRGIAVAEHQRALSAAQERPRVTDFRCH